MQVHKIMSERKSQTCTDVLVLSVVAILERAVEVFHPVLRDSKPRVAHYDADAVIFVVGRHAYVHLAILSAVFGCIGYQIIDDLVEFVGVNPTHHAPIMLSG